MKRCSTVMSFYTQIVVMNLAICGGGERSVRTSFFIPDMSCSEKLNRNNCFHIHADGSVRNSQSKGACGRISS